MMLKQLKRIGRIKFPVYPATFGQYVALVAQGLGIKRYAMAQGVITGWHDTTNYRFDDIKNISFYIDRNLEDVKESFFPAPAKATASETQADESL